MNQEPVLIKGVVAFPNPNGNREIRFIDAFYHDLFKIPDQAFSVPPAITTNVPLTNRF